MEKEHKLRLQTQWRNLLENITDYDGIIDDLFTEQILTRPMKEKILQKKGVDRLRELLDMLPRRGPRAFDTFYQVLVERGEGEAADCLRPELSAQRQSQTPSSHSRAGVQEGAQPSPALPQDDELPSKWPDFTKHDPLRMELTKVSERDTVIRTLFDRAVGGSDLVYAMHKPTRGIFLLISNELFEKARTNGEELRDRKGNEKDAIALEKLFKQLHFRVEVKENQCAQEIEDSIRTYAGQVQATDNCFACAVLTHGERGMVYGVDGKTVDLEVLKAAVTDGNQMLIGKPKIFFIQACQGKKVDNGVTASPEGAGEPGKGKGEDVDLRDLAEKFTGIKLRQKEVSDAASEGRVSSKSDIFVAMATVPDFVSWRDTSWGTWFVQAVTFIFSRFSHKYEINQLMTRVNNLVSRAETRQGYKQVSVYSSSLNRDFYFFPGLQHGVPESSSSSSLEGPQSSG